MCKINFYCISSILLPSPARHWERRVFGKINFQIFMPLTLWLSFAIPPEFQEPFEQFCHLPMLERRNSFDSLKEQDHISL